MIGAGSFVTVLMLAGASETIAARPVASAVDLGRKWGIVTSVRRSPERNRAVGGAGNSFHLHGRAIDIARRPGVRHADIDAAYRKAGYILIESLDEGDHSHFAFGLVGGPEKAVAAAIPGSASIAGSRCASRDDAALTARRRPDRTNECDHPPEAPARLRPVDPAP